MMRTLRTSLAPALLIAAAAAVTGTPASAQGCLSASEARKAAQAGEVLPLSQVLGEIQSGGGEILPPPQFCNRGGQYVYVVRVLRPNGDVESLTVDAASGSIIGRSKR
jgi:hypothetical protein